MAFPIDEDFFVPGNDYRFAVETGLSHKVLTSETFTIE